MTQNTPDLWPMDFGPVDAHLPVVILREQAALLSKKTSGLVQAEVRTSSREHSALKIACDFEHRFYLIAPALDNYRYYLFMVGHGAADLYPVHFYPRESEGEDVELRSEKEFLNKLAEVFSSDDTRRIIQTLIAQSQAA
ncbi:MAG TPA: hypothetical protein VG269_21185 [Tepidisphaeraceae bacterium]|jgi:hypothetical protein|nr:hypothetical protein [Tepidisphaeraceae bacterium]